MVRRTHTRAAGGDVAQAIMGPISPLNDKTNVPSHDKGMGAKGNPAGGSRHTSLTPSSPSPSPSCATAELPTALKSSVPPGQAPAGGLKVFSRRARTMGTIKESPQRPKGEPSTPGASTPVSSSEGDDSSANKSEDSSGRRGRRERYSWVGRTMSYRPSIAKPPTRAELARMLEEESNDLAECDEENGSSLATPHGSKGRQSSGSAGASTASKKGGGQRVYTRRPIKQAQEREAANIKEFWQEQKAFFDDVDNFSLCEESPPPPGAPPSESELCPERPDVAGGQTLDFLLDEPAGVAAPSPAPSPAPSGAAPVAGALPGGGSLASTQKRVSEWVSASEAAAAGRPSMSPLRTLGLIEEAREAEEGEDAGEAGVPEQVVAVDDAAPAPAAKEDSVEGSIACPLEDGGDSPVVPAAAAARHSVSMAPPPPHVSIGASRRSSILLPPPGRESLALGRSSLAHGRESLALGRPSFAPGGRESQTRASLAGRRSSVLFPPAVGRPSMARGRPSMAPGLAASTLEEAEEEEAKEEVKKEVEAMAAPIEAVEAPATPARAADGPAVAEEAEEAAVAVEVEVEAEAEAEVEAEEEVEVEAGELTDLERLLSVCGQSLDPVAAPGLGDILGEFCPLKSVRKIGEGTFGEAFKGSGVVYKIVPMEGDFPVNGETQKRAHEMLAEAAIANRLSTLSDGGEANVTGAFVKTHRIAVCRGKYPREMVKEWERWDKANTSENDHPKCFPGEQLYIVFVVADGGRDLEHFEIGSFEEARAVLLQTTLALAVGEEACGFEHRDLHWGNLLLARDGEKHATARLRGVDIEMQAAGMRAVLIDFTLSRLELEDGSLAFCDLAQDPELFMGPKGDVQADTYRRMKQATRNKWSLHAPKTNSLWLHYLADIMLNEKSFPRDNAQTMELKSFRKRATSYKCASDALWDDLFKGQFTMGEEDSGRRGRGRAGA